MRRSSALDGKLVGSEAADGVGVVGYHSLPHVTAKLIILTWVPQPF